MQRLPVKNIHSNEAGQSLPLLGLFLVVLLGFTALSIDVGRYVWARTSMQAGVDAAALAAAQSMPSQTDAEAKAAEYFLDNTGFIQSQGENVSFQVTYPAGNKAIAIRGDADIPTYFARIFGVDEWHVWAEGEAESQVLDIAIVFDVSGSMCYDFPFLNTESTESVLMSPGNNMPKLAAAIPAGGGDSIVITLNSNAIFNSTTPATNLVNFGYSSNSRYHQQTSLSGRNGIIAIPTGTAASPNWSSYELFDITAVGPGANQLTVTRARSNNWTGGSTPKLAHVTDLPVYANRVRCDRAATSPTGPMMPFDGAVNAAQYFTTLFNTSYDKIGAARYSTNSALNSNLTFTHSSVSSSLGAIPYPDGSTNIAGGLAAGRLILDGSGKRSNAVRVLVLLTDGIANQVCGDNDTYGQGDYNNLPCSDTNSAPTGTAESHAYSEAIRAANGDIMIFTIGLGDGVNANFLERVADGGVNGVGPCQDNEPNCRYYFAPTTAQLDEAFQAIAEQTHIALVR